MFSGKTDSDSSMMSLVDPHHIYAGLGPIKACRPLSLAPEHGLIAIFVVAVINSTRNKVKTL